MKLKSAVQIFLCVVLLTPTFFAFETDQYNLPTVPLGDIGDEVSDYTRENLQKAIDKLNAKIAAHENCLQNRGKSCKSAEKERAELLSLRSEDAIAKEVFNLLGAGTIPFTKSGTWMNSHEFKAQPARFKTSYGDSIYKIVPTNYLTISPTVKLYGAQFGTDKIAHIFQQGYIYYKKAAKNSSEKKAVNWGRTTEKTYFGTLVSGVYSNGDLAANYAGMKFYQGLTHEIRIGESSRPPILIIENGFWKINQTINLRENLLKPFISDHFNEALNPSKYAFFLRSSVRGNVRKKACEGWRKTFSNLTRADFEKITQNLRLWHGEDYGFSGSENSITIADTCF